jgi:hypothetical protein
MRGRAGPAVVVLVSSLFSLLFAQAFGLPHDVAVDVFDLLLLLWWWWGVFGG